MDDVRARILSSDGALDSASDAMRGYSPNNKATPYPDDDDGVNLDLGDAPVYSQIDVCGGFR